MGLPCWYLWRAKSQSTLTGVEFGDGELLEVGDQRHHGEPDSQVAGDVQRAGGQLLGAGDLGGVEAEVPRGLERGDAALDVASQDEHVPHFGDLHGDDESHLKSGKMRKYFR